MAARSCECLQEQSHRYKRLVELEVQLRAKVHVLFGLAEQADRQRPPGWSYRRRDRHPPGAAILLRRPKQVLAAPPRNVTPPKRPRTTPKCAPAPQKPRLGPPTRWACADTALGGPAGHRPVQLHRPESRIMKNGNNAGFEQAYNAQAAVDQASRFIVACVTVQPCE